MLVLHIFEFFFLLIIFFIIINSIYLPVSFSNLMSFLGFCFPENYFLFDVILLYVEIFNIGLIILIVLLNTLSVILESFRFKPKNPYFYFNPLIHDNSSGFFFDFHYYEKHFPKTPSNYTYKIDSSIEKIESLFMDITETNEVKTVIQQFKEVLIENYGWIYKILSFFVKIIEKIIKFFNHLGMLLNYSEDDIWKFIYNFVYSDFRLTNKPNTSVAAAASAQELYDSFINSPKNQILFRLFPFLRDLGFFNQIFPFVSESTCSRLPYISNFFCSKDDHSNCKIYEDSDYNYTSLEFDPQTEEFFDFIFVLIPSIFILMILIPCVGYLYTSEFFFNWLLYDIKLDLIGYQWYWYYEFKIETLYSSSIYENNGYITRYCDFITVFSQEEDSFKRNLDVDIMMVLPQNINVLISISSGDVIHSWTIPGYTTKFDAIPGRTYCFINVISEVGYNWGQCSELCGANHAFMPSSLDVTTDRYSFDLTLTIFYYKK